MIRSVFLKRNVSVERMGVGGAAVGEGTAEFRWQERKAFAAVAVEAIADGCSRSIGASVRAVDVAVEEGRLASGVQFIQRK